MAHKKKAARAGTRTASNTAFNRHHHTAPDPYLGWFDLAKPLRNCQQKRNWQKGGRHGR